MAQEEGSRTIVISWEQMADPGHASIILSNFQKLHESEKSFAGCGGDKKLSDSAVGNKTVLRREAARGVPPAA